MHERGAGKLTTLVFGSLLIAAMYCGYKIIPFYYYYYEIESQFEQVIKVASTETDQEIRDKLLYHIRKAELPVDPADLKIERLERRMIISLPYQEVFYLSWQGKDYDIYTFKFHAFAEGEF